MQHTLWFTFTGNGNRYRVRTVQGQYCIEVTRIGNVAATDISKTDIGLAPNPTIGMVQLSSVTAEEIQVFDYMGRMVKHMVQGGNSIDLSGQPAGLYILQIGEQENLYSARVVKE